MIAFNYHRLPKILACIVLVSAAQIPSSSGEPEHPATLFPLSDIRLLPGPFADAAAANRSYLLAHDPDRLLAPFLREAGLKHAKSPYPNWESMGLDGHTAGHYIAALAQMIASGNDPDGEFGRRLDHMLTEMERVQKANGDGYIGGVPGSKEMWKALAAGDTGVVWKKWVPWYNVHKTFAGLRDAWLIAERQKARDLLVGLGDWCLAVTSGLSDDQMQQMLGNEYGGMNEAMADISTITGDKKYLKAAVRFNHRSVLDPLLRKEDKLTGLHANTQIPKIIGFEQIASITGNAEEHDAARFFWETVTRKRSVAFGGNSVSEHFNDPGDFTKVLEHREGPETCNTYNMLRLTEKLFTAEPEAGYADYYERALYNHILSSIDPHDPGYVYFTPLRPDHYRVYSTPEECFWCCVGTGMENPGRYGQFIYARDQRGIYVNLFIPSLLRVSEGFRIRQETRFPSEQQTTLKMELKNPSRFALRIRHPWWVPEGALRISVNGEAESTTSGPGGYATIEREWNNGDQIEAHLPMHIHVEPLPDGSDWAAILHGPIVLAAADGSHGVPDDRGTDGRMAHVAGGQLVPLDRVPSLISTAKELPSHIVPAPDAGPLRFRIKDVVFPRSEEGILLEPFYSLHHRRYQMYWQLTSAEKLEARKEQLAAEERALAALEAATLDLVKPGEQQSEVEHDYRGEEAESGVHNGRRWRHGKSIEYKLDPGNRKASAISVTYSGDDSGRSFDIFANDRLIATETLTAEDRGSFIVKRYTIPNDAHAGAGPITFRFVARNHLAGGLFEVRLLESTASNVERPESE